MPFSVRVFKAFLIAVSMKKTDSEGCALIMTRSDPVSWQIGAPDSLERRALSRIMRKVSCATEFSCSSKQAFDSASYTSSDKTVLVLSSRRRILFRSLELSIAGIYTIEFFCFPRQLLNSFNLSSFLQSCLSLRPGTAGLLERRQALSESVSIRSILFLGALS